MEEVVAEKEQKGEMTNEPLFSLLENLILEKLPRLGHFFLTMCAHEFPFLRDLKISDCSEMKMFNSKVSCPNLEYLKLYGAVSITALCSRQLPTAYFSKLEKLDICHCPKLRNLMCPSVSRGLLNLRTLWIEDCKSLKEVITEEEQQGEEITNEPLFPRLELLYLKYLPKLGHFFQMKRALESPLLRVVYIHHCPEMKMFVHQGSVSTSSLKNVNDDDKVKVDDLNKWMQQRVQF